VVSPTSVARPVRRHETSLVKKALKHTTATPLGD